MVVLLKTVSVWVSFIQIMRVRVQNKGKSVWKSRYIGDVSRGSSMRVGARHTERGEHGRCGRREDGAVARVGRAEQQRHTGTGEQGGLQRSSSRFRGLRGRGLTAVSKVRGSGLEEESRRSGGPTR